MTEEQIFEHERFMPLVGWSSKSLLPTERNRYSRYEDASQSTNVFPQIRLSDGKSSLGDISFCDQLTRPWSCTNILDVSNSKNHLIANVCSKCQSSV